MYIESRMRPRVLKADVRFAWSLNAQKPITINVVYEKIKYLLVQITHLPYVNVGGCSQIKSEFVVADIQFKWKDIDGAGLEPIFTTPN